MTATTAAGNNRVSSLRNIVLDPRVGALPDSGFRHHVALSMDHAAMLSADPALPRLSFKGKMDGQAPPR